MRDNERSWRDEAFIEAALDDRNIQAALREDLDRFEPRPDLLQSVMDELEQPQTNQPLRRRSDDWRLFSHSCFLSSRMEDAARALPSFPGRLVDAVGGPAAAVVHADRRRLLPAAALVAAMLLFFYWPFGDDGLTRKASAYWDGSGGAVAVNNASSYGAFFEREGVNPLVHTGDNTVCAFAVSVGAESFTAASRALTDGHLPDPDSVRVEEFINYFDQELAPPTNGDAFSLSVEGSRSPLSEDGRSLVRVGLRGSDEGPGDGVIARNVQAHVEFEPTVVSAYRQVGYEYERVGGDQQTPAMIADEVTTGYSVVALYEVEFHEGAQGLAARLVVAYQDPDTGLTVQRSEGLPRSAFTEALEQASPRFQLNAAVAQYAELLRGSYWAPGAGFEQALASAQRVSVLLPGDQRVGDLVELVGLAQRAASGTVM